MIKNDRKELSQSDSGLLRTYKDSVLRMLFNDKEIERCLERANSLQKKLLETNRIDDLKKAVADAEYQNKLFEEFNL